MKIFVDIQRFYENGKYVSNGVYTFLKKTFLLSYTALLKCFIYSRVKTS